MVWRIQDQHRRGAPRNTRIRLLAARPDRIGSAIAVEGGFARIGRTRQFTIEDIFTL
jgi:hypothetical protein